MVIIESLTGVTDHTNIIGMAAIVDTPAVKITIIKHLVPSTTVNIVHPDLTYISYIIIGISIDIQIIQSCSAT